MELNIQLAQASQTQEIFDLLQSCAADMREQGIFQWNENYPLVSHVEKDISNKSMYCLMEDERVAGIVVIDENQSIEYKTVAWQYHSTPILVVHRFAVHPHFQKQGIGKKLMDFALNFALENDYQSIRLDAYSENERTQRFYQNRGYIKRGEIHFPYREAHFNCYEKNLNPS